MRLVFVSVYTKVIFLCTEYIEKNLTPIRHKTAFEKFFFGSVQRAKPANPQKDACSSVINSVEYRFPYSALPISPLLLCLKATFVWRQHLMGVFAEMFCCFVDKSTTSQPQGQCKTFREEAAIIVHVVCFSFLQSHKNIIVWVKCDLCNKRICLLGWWHHRKQRLDRPRNQSTMCRC